MSKECQATNPLLIIHSCSRASLKMRLASFCSAQAPDGSEFTSKKKAMDYILMKDPDFKGGPVRRVGVGIGGVEGFAGVTTSKAKRRRKNNEEVLSVPSAGVPMPPVVQQMPPVVVPSVGAPLAIEEIPLSALPPAGMVFSGVIGSAAPPPPIPIYPPPGGGGGNKLEEDKIGEDVQLELF